METAARSGEPAAPPASQQLSNLPARRVGTIASSSRGLMANLVTHKRKHAIALKLMNSGPSAGSDAKLKTEERKTN